MRAFLSHSSEDKAFIEQVAGRLGRRRVHYDKWSFEGGVAFIDAILETLATSDAFILFASKASLQSSWVRMEISEAQQQLIAGHMKSALVVLIDEQTGHSQLPKWMQRSLVERMSTPRAAARAIEYHLNRLRGVEASPLYIGREGLTSEFSELLIPPLGETPPHLLLLGGLPGIGRRKFLQNAARDLLSLRLGPVFPLEQTDGLDRLHVLLLDELGGLDTKDQLAQAITNFRTSTPEERATELAIMLESASQGNVLPIIVDSGALLDARAHYTPESVALFAALNTFPASVVGVVHTKRPQVGAAELQSFGAIYLRVPPLDTNATRLLLTHSLRRSGTEATSEQIEELAPYLDGYPPAIQLAVAVAREYGIGYLLADKSGLVDFKIRTFAGVLEKLGLSDIEWKILKLLTSEVGFPIEAIVAALKLRVEEVTPALRRLIDLNLVIPSGIVFGIALPVRSAVYSLQGGLSQEEYTAIAIHLKATYWEDNDRLPPAEIVEATINALLHTSSQELRDFAGLFLPSSLFKVAKELYKSGGTEAWKNTISLLDNVRLLYPGHRQTLVLQCKTLIRLSEWNRAQIAIREVEQAGLPDVAFLRGFLFWKRRDYPQAVTAFREALRAGQTSPETFHGLASCLFRLRKYTEAAAVIKEGLEKNRPNSLLLDLGAQIAIASENHEDAEIYVDRLMRLRATSEYSHRTATLLGKQGNFAAALPFAKAARTGSHHRFEVEATYINCLIENRLFPEAQGLLDELATHQRFSNERKDVSYGLRCKLFLRQGRWREAEEEWNHLEEKTSPVHLGLRAEILEQKINDPSVSPGSRAEAQTERRTIEVSEVDAQMTIFGSEDSSADETASDES